MKNFLFISLKITMFRHNFLSSQFFMPEKYIFSEKNLNIPKI